jgi:hypothetical protein
MIKKKWKLSRPVKRVISQLRVLRRESKERKADSDKI